MDSLVPANNLDVPTTTISSLNKILFSVQDLLPYLSIAYIFLLLFLMAKLFSAYRQVHFIAHKNLITAPLALEIFAAKVAQQIGFSKKIKIWISHHIEVPATIGFLKPVILIPFASINHLTAYQLEAIILHELSHIKRNDYLVNLMISIVETILFFNPFIAAFVKIIKRERENCCDDLVLQYRYDPHSYATALLQLEQTRVSNVQLALGAVSGKKQLLNRIKRITGNHNEYQFNYGQKLLALLITTGIFCSLAWLSPSKLKSDLSRLSAKTNADKVFASAQLNNVSTFPAYKNKITTLPFLKNNIDQQKIKTIPPEKNQEKVESPITRIDQEKNIIIDEKELQNTYSENYKAIQNADNNDFRSSILKNIPKLPIAHLNLNINDEINKGLKQAYQEINKINWSKVQADINKSLAGINVDQLSKEQKAAILEAKKYISVLNLNKQQFNAPKILKEIQGQKLLSDSLKALRTTINNQAPARLSARGSFLNLNSAASNLKLIFNTKPNDNRSLKINTTTSENDESEIGFNGKELIIKNIHKAVPHSLNIPHVFKKGSESKRMIVEI
jgi:beta-lactamase regulating signal transducer with metallopeptidase domain